ncbi:HalOD1 output domain-containing protein [Natrinema soli]|uniref:HalOD1 output domain-containing protein n=1 Tax=Natrinema soli TaxID=1930624 RepID=A0ABD5SSY6_9EURY|nr:HalOD1 output domain-containing protein [Natrinema soli]
MQPTQSLSLKIVDKVAECEGVHPEELNPPIHNAINTDALDDTLRRKWEAPTNCTGIPATYSQLDAG